MCGIAGVIRIHEMGDGPPPPHLESIPEAWLDVLDDSIKHRGPDGQGRFRDRAVRADGTVVDVALVHRRLSIIDHAGGHQPMVHDGERLRPDLTYQPGETPIVASEVAPGLPIVAVVFNGCIYNHRELRAELEDAGHVFATDHSDTEVLVHGWREWSTKIYERLVSMHAVAAWDRNSRDLLISRDRFGEKPVYVLDTDRYSVVSSVVTSLSALHEPTIDQTQLVEWIAMGQHALSTPLTDIRQLAAATCLSMGLGETVSIGPASAIGKDSRVRSFRFAKQSGYSMKRAVDLIDHQLDTAVRERLTADVDLACFLSGGLDSSLIAVAAQRALAERDMQLKTVCVRMPDSRYDESAVAREVAEIIGSDHHEVESDAFPAGDLISLIEQIGLPFGDSSLLPTYWVSRAAQSFAGVAIGGDGGDELFLGYERQIAAGDLVPLRFLSLFAPVLPARMMPRSDARSSWDKAARMLIASSKRSYRSLLSIYQHPDLGRLLPKTARLCSWNDRANSTVLAQSYDLDHYLPGDLLRKVDSASMACPIEVRSPLLDQSLCAVARSLPFEVLSASKNRAFISHSTRKGLLKRVARRYLPDHIVDRPKQGFAIPIGEWFRSDYGGMRQLLHDHMNSSDPFPGLGESGVEINMGFVRTMMREHDAAGEKSINPWHGRDHSQRLYMVLVLSIWAKWLDRVRRGEG